MKKYQVFAQRPTFIIDLSRSYSPSALQTFAAYDNETHAFTEMYKQYRNGVKAVETRQSFERKIEAISLGRVKKKEFSIPRPLDNEISAILEQEAKAKLHGQKHTIAEEKKYIQDHFKEIETDRIAKWNEARTLFYSIEQSRQEREKQRLQQEYQQKRQAMFDILEGEPYAIEQGIEDLASTIKIPLDFDFEYTYDKAKGRVAVEIEIINGIQLPLQKAVRLASGRASIKNKLVREINEETKDTILSFAYLFASKVFEISLNISMVEVTIWKENRDAAYCWIEFPREGIMRDNPRYLVPAFDYASYRRVIDIRQKTASVEIASIPATKFRKLVDAERLKTIAETPKMKTSQSEQVAYVPMEEAQKLLRKLGYDSELNSAIEAAKGSRIVAVSPRYKQMIADEATAAIYGRSDDDDYAYGEPSYSDFSLKDRDPLFEQAARLVVSAGLASTSSLQRTFEVGYNRAGRIMDQLEAAGIVGPATGGKPRKVLISLSDLDNILGY